MGTMSNQQPKKAVITVAPRTDEAFDFDAILRQRMEGDPFGLPSDNLPPFADKAQWAYYIGNSLANDNAHYEMQARMGWRPVKASELPAGVKPEDVGWRASEDGTLVRGTRGDEVLYKMPKEVREALLHKQAAINKRGTGSAKAVKADVAQAVAGQMGSEAADFAQSNITITGSDREGPLGA
jgi:hypothetical protein